MQRSAPLKRTGGLKRTGQIKTRRGPKLGTATGLVVHDDWTDEVRTTALERAGHRCEVEGAECSGDRLQLHHRLSRNHGDHTVANAIVSCGSCHTMSTDSLHRHPDRFERGWMIRDGVNTDPSAVPWLRRGIMFDPGSAQREWTPGASEERISTWQPGALEIGAQASTE